MLLQNLMQAGEQIWANYRLRSCTVGHNVSAYRIYADHELVVDQTFACRAQAPPGNAELGRGFATDGSFAPEASPLFRSPPRSR